MFLSRRSLSVALGFALCLLSVASCFARPNVLFIIVDDLRPEMGCYGVEGVTTPNLDSFANEALLFERAYCQIATCRASRMSLLSGFRPTDREIGTNRDVRKGMQDIDPLPLHFKKNGYRTIGFGKIAHNGEEDDRCWSKPHRMPENAAYEYRTRAGRALVEKIRKDAAEAGKPDPFRQIPKKIHRGMAWENLDVEDDDLGDGQIAELVLDALDEKSDQPFFLAAGFLRPHLPFVAPKRYWDLYDPEKLPHAKSLAPPPGSSPLVSNRSRELLLQYRNLPESLPLEPSTERALVHGYYACVSYIDAQIGRLLQGLKTRGLANDTIVVITADHGFQLGDHGMWGKATNFELSTRVPLLIRVPGSKSKGSRTDSLVELVSLYPTLCELAELPLPGHLQGTSFANLFEDPEAKLRKTAFSQYYRGEATGYSVRTENFRYTEWRDGKTDDLLYRALFDYRLDEVERENLVDQAAFAEEAAKLSGILNRGWREGVYE